MSVKPGAPVGRVPTAILMSGTGSNARKILEYLPGDSSVPHYEVRLILSDNAGSNYRKIAEEHGVEARLNDIYEFHEVPHSEQGLSPENRRRLRVPLLRERFDGQTNRILASFQVQLVALAGYDWLISPFLCRDYIVINVHPDFRGYQREYQQLSRLLAEDIIPANGPVILGGDFNTTHQTQIYRLVNQHLQNAHWEAGWGFGFTFPFPVRRIRGKYPLLPLVRIDHIFYNDYFFAHNAGTLTESGGSDHLPVVAEFSWIKSSSLDS